MAKVKTKSQSSTSPLLEDKVDVVGVPTYSVDDQKYFDQLKVRLETAKRQRERLYTEFGNLTYLQRYQQNKEKANTVLPTKKNEEDVVISTGTLEQKLEAVLSSVNNLNLSPEVRAYDENDVKVAQAGQLMEDVLFATSELDEDEEKKLLRQKEMLVQGEVFVQEKWVEKFKKKKNLNQKFTGQFKGVDWTERLQKYFEGPSRQVKYGPNVYLGDITQFAHKDQPFWFEAYVDGYEQVKSIFGNWENWDFVPKTRSNISNTGDTVSSSGDTSNQTIADRRWSLLELQDNQVEVIVYEDRWNDEFNIILNGVMMLPAGFPLSEISPNGEYTVEKQVYKVVDAHFAYGRGFIQSTEKTSELLDEMLKLSVLKTRKSFMPAYVNTSKRVISARVLQAGKITMGIPADALKAIGETSEGVTPSEFQMIKLMQDTIDNQTVSPQFQGQQGKSGTTATEVVELQKQAKLTVGLIVFSCAMLEKKIGYLRLWNCLENWFKPMSKTVLSDETVNKYRQTSKSANIPNEGLGERQVIPVQGKVPSSDEIRALENADKDVLGYPVQKIFVNADEMKNAIKKWYIVVNPKEKDTSDYQKLMFRQELNDMTALMQFGAMPNVDDLEDSYAKIYNKDRSKAFKKGQAPLPGQQPPEGADPNAGAAIKAPGNPAGMPQMANTGQAAPGQI